MNGTAVVLVVAGAFAAAIHGVLSKLFQRGDWESRSALVTALAMSGAAVTLFAYSFTTGGPQMSPGWVIPVIVTGTLNIGIMYAKTRARAIEDVSLVAPIDSTTPAIVIVTAMIIVGEYPTILGWIGIWVLVIGTYVLNIQSVWEKLAERVGDEGGWRGQVKIWLAPFVMLGRSAGVRWAFVAVGLSTVSLPYDGLVARRVDVGFGFGLVCVIAALGNWAVVVWRREYRGIGVKAIYQRAAALGVSFAIATILFGLAFQLSLIAYVGTMKRVTIPMTIVLAYLLLGERRSFRQRMAGGIIMVVGAVLIALAK